MPLLFPPADHIPLKHPPLREVVCQVRFSPILKIAEGGPVDFQEEIRDRFPKYNTKHAWQFRLTPGQSPELMDKEPPLHRFSDKDEVCTVSLGLNFFAVSTTNYQSWMSFANDLRFVTEKVQRVYKVPYSARIGLRYINDLNTQSTGLPSLDPDILDILRPDLIGLLRREEIREPFLALTQIRSRQEEGEFTFAFGISQLSGMKEKSFVLDFDRYIEEEIELDTDDLLRRCDRYHGEIYSAFRWCILENALEIFGSTN